jgi:hypothetical protein
MLLACMMVHALYCYEFGLSNRIPIMCMMCMWIYCIYVCVFYYLHNYKRHVCVCMCVLFQNHQD